MKTNHPRIKQLKIKITQEKLDGMSCILVSDLKKALKKAKLSQKEFDKLFGVQTCPLIKNKTNNGYKRALYTHDVEAVLERMLSGKLTGTQLFWD